MLLPAVIGCASGGGFSGRDSLAIDGLFTEYAGANVPGASVIVIRDGAVVFRRASLRLATQPPMLPSRAETQYGFGWFVDEYRGNLRWRHTGETSGFTNAIQRFPDRRLTVIVLTNRNGGTPWTIAERIADLFLGAGG